MSNSDDYKNGLPSDTDDRPASDNPRELRTENDDADPLTREEADIAGVSSRARMIYGEDSFNPNAADQMDR